MPPLNDDPQALTLQLFTILMSLRLDWTRSLIIASGLGRPFGFELARAANIAGAVSLSVDSSPGACRSAMRSGAVDFLVNTVDEALRVVKNEVRKGLPLSVALELDPANGFGELLERGVLPQLFAFCQSDESTVSSVDLSAAIGFQRQGVPVLQCGSPPKEDWSFLNFDKLLDECIGQKQLRLETFGFDSSAALRTFDAAVRDLFPVEDWRRRWAAIAPRHFAQSRSSQGTAYRRVLYLTAEEFETLTRIPLAGRV